MKKSVLLALLPFSMTSCTLSFQNIDTHGSASDLVDETQANTPTVSPNISVPVSATPSLPSLSALTPSSIK